MCGEVERLDGGVRRREGVTMTMDCAEKQAGRHVEHVTLWNRADGYKLSGNSAPHRRNLSTYLEEHPMAERYAGQDRDDTRAENWRMDTLCGDLLRLSNGRVFLRNKHTHRKLGGNSCPLYGNLPQFFSGHGDRYERVPWPSQRRYDAECDCGVRDGMSDRRCCTCEERRDAQYFATAASQHRYGCGRHDNLFEVPLTPSCETPDCAYSSSDETFLTSVLCTPAAPTAAPTAACTPMQCTKKSRQQSAQAVRTRRATSRRSHMHMHRHSHDGCVATNISDQCHKRHTSNQ